jgi:N-acetylglutamate synthase-like GNAT family acetyltransferase
VPTALRSAPFVRTARLRWFILDAAHRGKGIGCKLLHRSLEFCRNQQVAKLYLWTVDELPQASHLYESVGFTIVEQVVGCRYSVPLLHLKMELELD